MQHYGKVSIFSLLALSLVASWSPSEAAAKSHTHRAFRHTSHSRHASHSRHVLQCVAFVRQNTAFQIRGNAGDWWSHADGLYARGNLPEVGSVLSFRSTRRMPLGHVAVVRSVIDGRTILIDQSHWASSGISRDVRVVDISPDNDWSAVRVALNGHNDSRLGSIYPTHGFIYARPETAPSVTGSSDLLAENNKLSTQTASLPEESNSSGAFDVDAPNRALR
ncbi:CHAP domain-containing protein [Acetobacteraceae bacterium ESL0709]|nr:CHAP domain-containing protein [Acetobacteraceae bacterium ESL0697]MDF7677204.1 CHAP domain-containing protein [Acetobacteraceae bacterium ESL0709]